MHQPRNARRSFAHCDRGAARSSFARRLIMVGANSRLFIGGLPISKELGKDELLKVVSAYAKDVEVIRDSEGCFSLFSLLSPLLTSFISVYTRFSTVLFNLNLFYHLFYLITKFLIGYCKGFAYINVPRLSAEKCTSLCLPHSLFIIQFSSPLSHSIFHFPLPPFSIGIEKLNGAPFQKGLLRVEHAQESFMDRYD
jgi:hypothetical protein